MEVSKVCRAFIDCANKRDWRTAVINRPTLQLLAELSGGNQCRLVPPDCHPKHRPLPGHRARLGGGTAIDLTSANILDPRGDNLIQFGLHLISGAFNSNGWYWGAGFPTEDAQHFEAGAALVGRW